MLDVKLEDKQFLSPKFIYCIFPVNFAFQAFLKVWRSIKWINTFCRKKSWRFVRMRRLKDLDRLLKTLDHLHRFMVLVLCSVCRDLRSK